MATAGYVPETIAAKKASFPTTTWTWSVTCRLMNSKHKWPRRSLSHPWTTLSTARTRRFFQTHMYNRRIKCRSFRRPSRRSRTNYTVLPCTTTMQLLKMKWHSKKDKWVWESIRCGEGDVCRCGHKFWASEKHFQTDFVMKLEKFWRKPLSTPHQESLKALTFIKLR